MRFAERNPSGDVRLGGLGDVADVADGVFDLRGSESASVLCSK